MKRLNEAQDTTEAVKDTHQLKRLGILTKFQPWKELVHEIEFKYFDKKDNSLFRSLYWFLNFEDDPLMSCRLRHFPRGLGET